MTSSAFRGGSGSQQKGQHLDLYGLVLLEVRGTLERTWRRFPIRDEEWDRDDVCGEEAMGHRSIPGALAPWLRPAEDFPWAMPFGWGASRGRVLQALDSVILRAAAAEVVARMRQVKPLFASDFGGVPPLVMNHVPHSGDSGSGVFATNGTLLAVHKRATGFFFVDDNADPSEVPVGMGWWDVTPDQVGTGNTPVDPDQFATC